MDYKTKNDYNDDLKKVFNLLTITGHYKVIGSASLKKIKYVSDYDLEEDINKSSDSITIETRIYNLFKNKFIIAKNDPHIFITDFKCGIDKSSGEPLRWDYDAMMRGTNKNIKFQDTLTQKSTIKLDIIKLINGVFTEFSENYYFKLGSKKNYDNTMTNKKLILKSIQDDAHDLLKDNNPFKALKRSFAYKLMKDPKKFNDELNLMIEFFNSDTGLLYKSKGDMDILLLILDNKFRKPNIEDIKTNLLLIKNNLKSLVNNKILKLFDDASIKSINKIKKHLEKIIYTDTKKFINNYDTLLI